MSGFPKKRAATAPKKGGGYQKVGQVKHNSRWLPPISSAPLAVSDERTFRATEDKKLEGRRLHDFKFKITRGDGAIIDHTLLSTVQGILIWQEWMGGSSGGPGAPPYVGGAHGYDPIADPDDAQYWIYEDPIEGGKVGTWFYNRGYHPYEKKFSYDTVTQIWTVPINYYPNKFIRRHKLFWTTFYCRDSVLVMLRPPSGYIENTEEFYQDIDRTIPKFHLATVPYYKET